MTILCIDTSTSICSAAICKDGVPAEECICREGSNHARLLPRYIQHLLQYAKEHQLSVDAVALSEGPGSYTGLRIGAATAKGLCYGLNIPLIPISTLRLLAFAAKEKLADSQQLTANSVLCPMIDARRMEVYTVLYDWHLQPLTDIRAVVVNNTESLIPDSAADRKPSSVFYFGDGAEKCVNVLNNPDWHYLPDVELRSSYLAVLAESDTRAIREQSEIAYYEPYYLKDFIAAPSHVKGLL